MPEMLTAEQQSLRANILAFASQHLDPVTDPQRNRVISASKAAGFYRMTQPKSFGGSAASNLELVILRDELASQNTGNAHWVFGSGPGVLGGCDEPLRSKFLQPVLEGELQGSFGFTEPDNAPHPTKGTIEGTSLIVNGQKSYVTGGNTADFINTLVRIDDNPTIVVIPTDTKGVVKEKVFTSLDGSSHAAFRFTDVQVPVDYCVGKPGDGLPRAMGQIGDTRLAIAAQCVGLTRWVHDFVGAHLRGTDRSGKPRADSPAIRLRFGEMRVRAYAARSMLYRTARLADSDENAVNEGAACKVYATETLTDAIDVGIQLVGGNAVVEGHPLAELYRFVRGLRLAEGATDTLYSNISRGYFDLDKGRI